MQVHHSTQYACERSHRKEWKCLWSRGLTQGKLLHMEKKKLTRAIIVPNAFSLLPRLYQVQGYSFVLRSLKCFVGRFMGRRIPSDFRRSAVFATTHSIFFSLWGLHEFSPMLSYRGILTYSVRKSQKPRILPRNEKKSQIKLRDVNNFLCRKKNVVIKCRRSSDIPDA